MDPLGIKQSLLLLYQGDGPQQRALEAFQSSDEAWTVAPSFVQKRRLLPCSGNQPAHQTIDQALQVCYTCPHVGVELLACLAQQLDEYSRELRADIVKRLLERTADVYHALAALLATRHQLVRALVLRTV